MEVKYPATHVAHWATGPVNCCGEHARQLVGLGSFLGAHVALTKAEDGAECSNCVNEHKNDTPKNTEE